MLHLSASLSCCFLKQKMQLPLYVVTLAVFCTSQAFASLQCGECIFKKNHTCSGVCFPGVSLTTLIIRLPWSQPFNDLKTSALFAPYVVDLHGCFTLCCKVQVLLGQMCPQLPDLKLKMVGMHVFKEKEKIRKVRSVIGYGKSKGVLEIMRKWLRGKVKRKGGKKRWEEGKGKQNSY